MARAVDTPRDGYNLPWLMMAMNINMIIMNTPEWWKLWWGVFQQERASLAGRQEGDAEEKAGGARSDVALGRSPWHGVSLKAAQAHHLMGPSYAILVLLPGMRVALP